MIKILFFDIDGTLLELGKKEMHQELVDALNLVKQKGIKIGSLTLTHSQNSQMSFMYGFFLSNFYFLLLYVL